MAQVSIITPTYNCAKFIAQTIESVLAQSYTDWEMIISDDCSTDNTQEVIRPYLEADSRIKYISNEKNSGAAITRNNALKVAQGRWIAFLDSDDLWQPEKLERQIAFMESNGYAFSYTDYTVIDEDSQSLGQRVIGPNRITKLGMHAYCWMGCLTVMYDSVVVGLVQIEDIKKNNDYAMWLKIVEKADCYRLAQSLAQYRKRTGSISNHNYVSLIKWHYKLFREAEHLNSFVSGLLTLGNIFFGVVKKILYICKIC